MTTSPSEEASWKKPDSTQRKKSFTIAPHWRQLGSYRGSGRCNGRRDNGPTCMGLNAAGERPRRRWESPNALLSLCGGLLLALPCLFTRLHCGTGTSLPRRTHARTHSRTCTQLKTAPPRKFVLTFLLTSEHFILNNIVGENTDTLFAL